MKTILTLKYGSKYTCDDVNRIYDQTNGIYNYVCLTDDPAGLYPQIETRPIDEEYGIWNKVTMLKHTDLGHVLYLDLDIVIQKGLDIFFETSYNNTICYTHWKDKNFPTDRVHNTDPKLSYLGNYNSSVLSWVENSAKYISDKFLKQEDYYMTKYAGGDDRFYWHETDMNIFPKGLVYSFVYGAEHGIDNDSFKYRPDYSIALLNGQEQFPKAGQQYYDALSLHEMGKQI